MNSSSLLEERKTKMSRGVKAIEIIASVKCAKCGKLHEAESTDYVHFYGNVIVGLDDVILSNTDEKGRVVSSTIYCRTRGCLGYFLGQLLPEDKVETPAVGRVER
jgi:hypothetical protein